MSLLDVIRRVRTRAFAVPAPHISVQGRKVLLVHLSSDLGDALLLSPVIRALLSAGAKPPVGLIVPKRAARMLRHVDLRVRFHLYPEALLDEAEATEDEVLSETLKMSVGLRKRGYAIAVDLGHPPEDGARTWLERSDAPVRLGFLREGESRARVLTWGTPEPGAQAMEHRSSSLARPLFPLGLGALPSEVGFVCSDKDAAAGEALWGSSPRVLLLPRGGDEAERLPASVFCAAAQVATRGGGSVVVAGEPQESGRVREVSARIAPGASTYVRKSLGPLVALVRSADIVVGQDTAATQIAFLSGRRTIALFGKLEAPQRGPMRADPRFVTLSVPAEAARDVGPVVERWVVEHLRTQLDGLAEEIRRCAR